MNDISHFLKAGSPRTINVKDGDGKTPLHLAASNGMMDIVMSLIKKKAKVDVKDKNGYTPLHDAAKSGQYDIAEVLIESKANIHAITNEKNSVLTFMVQGDSDSPKRIEIIEKILPKGINKENINKEIPFTLACGFGTVKIVKLLLQHNSSINHKRLVFLFYSITF